MREGIYMVTRVTFPNSRMASIKMAGGIREILTRAEEMEREGRSIIHMEIGRPDFDSPECAKEAAVAALQAGNVHYTDMAGAYDLRCAVAEKYQRENKYDGCRPRQERRHYKRRYGNADSVIFNIA